MSRVMVRYKVKPDQAKRNEELVRAVYEELASAQPAGLRYATLVLADGVSFVHLSETANGNPLSGLESFQRFQEGIGERCDEPPVVADVREVGSYRFFADGE